MIKIFCYIMLGLSGIFLLCIIYCLIKNIHCYKLSEQISNYVFHYNIFAIENGRSDMIDYGIDCYTTSFRWLNPFKCWTKRGMCYDKEKYDKLKRFIDEHKEELQLHGWL